MPGKNNILSFVALCVFMLGLAACGTRRQQAAASDLPRPVPFSPFATPDSSGWISYPSGLRMYVVQEGPGNLPSSGSPVTVHYWARIVGGNEFGNTFKEGVPLRFYLGNAVPGFNEAISRLRMGSEAVFIIPPSLGYGEAGLAPNIPPNSALEYHVKFLGTF